MRRPKTPSPKLLSLCTLLAAGASFGQTLPTAKSIAAEMGMAWNLGNTMEVPNDPTGWGNPLPTQKLIDSVKAAGFKTVRIPAAWRSHSEADSLTIKPAWLAQVKSVVDYCIKDSLFVILNIHWDEGWLENRIDDAVGSKAIETSIKTRQGAYWRQIANAFKSYDRHLLFAGTNEPNVEDAASQAMLKSFLQIFIDTVRATGGNNASRTLIIQGPSTDIEKTNKLMTTLPTDNIADRLMAEVHFYPYQFTLMDAPADWGGPTLAQPFYYWGKNNHSTTDTQHNSTWGEEAFVDQMFDLMKDQFIDRNIPVVIGEFGAIKRTTLTGADLALHIVSRRYFYNYVVSACKKRGMIPVAWDAGNRGDKTMSVFDRRDGSIYDLGLLNAMRDGMGLPKLPGDTSLVPTSGAKAMKVLYSAKDSLGGQVELGVAKRDMSGYDSVIVRAYVNGESTYDSAGATRSGYLSLNIAAMSGGWKWTDAPLKDVVIGAWKDYRIPIRPDTAGGALSFVDPTQVDYLGLVAYSKAYHGTIYVDHIIFRSKSGAYDTLYSFNTTVPEKFEGNVVSVSSISVGAVPSDLEWKTATKSYTVSIAERHAAAKRGLRTQVSDGILRAIWTSQAAGAAQVSLKDLQGRTIWSRPIAAVAGENRIELPVAYRGVAVLQIRQGGARLAEKIHSR